MAPVKAQKTRDNVRELEKENPSSGFPSNSEICRQISEAKMVKKALVTWQGESLDRILSENSECANNSNSNLAEALVCNRAKPLATKAKCQGPHCFYNLSTENGKKWLAAAIGQVRMVFLQILAPHLCISLRPQSSSSSVHPTAVDDEASSEHRHKPDRILLMTCCLHVNKHGLDCPLPGQVTNSPQLSCIEIVQLPGQGNSTADLEYD